MIFFFFSATTTTIGIFFSLFCREAGGADAIFRAEALRHPSRTLFALLGPRAPMICRRRRRLEKANGGKKIPTHTNKKKPFASDNNFFPNVLSTVKIDDRHTNRKLFLIWGVVILFALAAVANWRKDDVPKATRISNSA